MSAHTFHRRLKSLKRKTKPNTYPHFAYELLVRDTEGLTEQDEILQVLARYEWHWWRCHVLGHPGTDSYLAVSETVKQLPRECF